MEKEVCFISDADNSGGGWASPKADFPPATGNQWSKNFYRQKWGRGSGRGYMQKQHSDLWQSSSNWPSVVWPASFLIVLGAVILQFQGFPNGASGKESACRCWRHRFNPWIGKIPWRRAWETTSISLPGESHGQRSLQGDYSPWGRRKSNTTEVT